MKKFFGKSAYVAALILVFTVVISCEEDFTDIGSGVISNTKFETDNLVVDVVIENSPITEVKSDNLSTEPGQYLLGVKASTEYEKIAASIVSQVTLGSSLELIDSDTVAKYETSTTHIVTTIDTAFIKLPYQVTLNDDADGYELDSIIGDQSKSFTLNVYQTSKYLSALDPTDPSKTNSYNSNDVFQTIGGKLNSALNFQFRPQDTVTEFVINRRLNNGIKYDSDTVSYLASTSSTVPLPIAIVPLDEAKIKSIFLDKYGSTDFDSQNAFNNYFRGIILEATGTEGSLISFNFNGTVNPSIEVYYTNTVLNTSTNDTIKTFKKNDSYLLSGIRAASYEMEEKTYAADKIVLQGAAGSEAAIKLFGADDVTIANKITELKGKDLLVNDATLAFYINQDADISTIPSRLFLYKSDQNSTNPIYSHITDAYTEGLNTFGGLLELDSEGKPEKYTFRITDYISDILSGETDYSSTLRLKVINTTDLIAVTDTVYKNYNWNPKVVTLLNHSAINGEKKVELKISYTKKKN